MTDYSNHNITGINLTGANLTGENFTNAIITIRKYIYHAIKVGNN